MTFDQPGYDTAVSSIKRLPFNDGPNFFTADVPGWGISAPTEHELLILLTEWFTEDEAPQPPSQETEHGR